MSEVITTIAAMAASAAVGFSGKWGEVMGQETIALLKKYFKELNPKAAVKADANAAKMIASLGIRLSRLEEEGAVDRAMYERALEDPGFGILLKSALWGAAQTDAPEKHYLLAHLLAERLASEPETLLSLSSRLACDVVLNTTTTQLRTLGAIATFNILQPRCFRGLVINKVDPSEYASRYNAFLAEEIPPHSDLHPTRDDLDHLEATGCLTQTPDEKKTLRERIDAQLPRIYSLSILTLFLRKPEAKTPLGLLDRFNESGILAYKVTPTGKALGLLTQGALTGKVYNLKDFFQP